MWTLDMANCIQLCADSMYPQGSRPTVDPIPRFKYTHNRLLAGYLLQYEETHNTPLAKTDPDGYYHLMYVDAYFQNKDAKLTFYEDESCEAKLFDICVHPHINCEDKIGIQGTRFILQDFQFICRTPWEKKLWYRTICNIRIKLLGMTAEFDKGLPHFRDAIRKHMKILSFGIDDVPLRANEPLVPVAILDSSTNKDVWEKKSTVTFSRTEHADAEDGANVPAAGVDDKSVDGQSGVFHRVDAGDYTTEYQSSHGSVWNLMRSARVSLECSSEMQSMTKRKHRTVLKDHDSVTSVKGISGIRFANGSVVQAHHAVLQNGLMTPSEDSAS
eukprot:GEMP01045002.1.p1 GENE.GEMP01045002.1~~GEMP01045002.1.p1  ORF type:complete len:329 (+),score=47.62 GEMP01045002.1:382-1368(+)